MTSPATSSIPLDHGQRWRAFWVCVSVAALTILDLSKVNVALPSIEAAFGAASTALASAVVSWFAATKGGDHRDNEVDLRGYFSFKN